MSHLTVGALRGKMLMTTFNTPLPPVDLDSSGGYSTSSFLDIDIARGAFFFRPHCDRYKACDTLWPLEGEVLFLDIATRGVSLERA